MAERAKHTQPLSPIVCFAKALGEGNQQCERELEDSLEPTSRPALLNSLRTGLLLTKKEIV